MPKHVRIDWNQPLISALTQRLLASETTAFIDLTRTTLIVPTVQSGRRLREALAVAASHNGTGLFPPQILTADQFLESFMPTEGLANPSTILAAWALVLDSIDTDAFRAVFPTTPPKSNGWLLGMAERLTQLRRELGEAGLDFTTVATAVEESPFEPLRWQQIAQLETLYLQILASLELDDPLTVRREIAQTITAPANVDRIILAATPDPQTLPLTALKHLDTLVSIEVWSYGPDTSGQLFDSWGRPDASAWEHRALDLEKWDCHLSPQTDMEAVANCIATYVTGKQPESVAIGLATSTLNPVVADALSRSQVPHFDPGGELLVHSDLGRLSERLVQLSAESDVQHIRNLLLHPDCWKWLKSQVHESASQVRVLQQLDTLIENHLASDLAGLLYFARRETHFAHIDQALRAINELASRLASAKHIDQALAEILQLIYQETTIPAQNTEWKERAAALRSCLESIVSTQPIHERLPGHFQKQSLLRAIKSARTHPTRPQDAHDLLGWLELLWNDAPHLIIAGLNEGFVPESVSADAFLPEPIREHLGLRTNLQRLTRDAYLLEAACRRRTHGRGRIDLLVPQMEQDKTPLKPSRLLFQGPRETLIPRARLLFSTPAEPQRQTQQTAAWKLIPPPSLAMPQKLSVSALRSYLECPFRFFLKHILKMQPLNIESRELTPAKFGTLLHNSLSKFNGRYWDQHLKESELYNELIQEIESELESQYGSKLSFALRLQKEALITRAAAFAQATVEDIQANGSIRITNTEKSFLMNFETCSISGQIDRIDEREGRIELIDYKTADTPKSPSQAHLSVVGKKPPPSHLPDEAYIEVEGKSYRWTDLQLPLYLLSYDKPYDDLPQLTYFNLAKTLDKSKIDRWDHFSREHLASAKACAEAVIRQIQDGVFWPPNNDIREEYDDFAAYFPDGIEHSVDADAFRHYRFSASK